MGKREEKWWEKRLEKLDVAIGEILSTKLSQLLEVYSIGNKIPLRGF